MKLKLTSKNLKVYKGRTWRFICAGFLIILASCSTKDKNTFELSGNVKGLNDTNGELIVYYAPGKADTLGKIVIKDNHFQLSGELESPILATIIIESPKYYTSFWLGPGIIDVTLDTANTNDKQPKSLIPVVKGSPEQELYEQFMQNYKIVYKDLDVAYDSMKKSTNASDKKRLEDRVDKLREDAQKIMSKKMLEFASKNNSSVVAAYLMRSQIDDTNNSIDTLSAILSGFSDNVKKSQYYKSIEQEFNILKSIQPGKTAPDFTLLDPKDKPISLSSLRGKVVLIDFWASWCKPCIASIPELKGIYNDYKNEGFEILGVSDDSKKDAWINSMAQNKIPWQNVIDEFPKPPKPFGPARVGVLYGIHYIPTTILIDKKGIIVAKNLHGDKLRDKIKEVL